VLNLRMIAQAPNVKHCFRFSKAVISSLGNIKILGLDKV